MAVFWHRDAGENFKPVQPQLRIGRGSGPSRGPPALGTPGSVADTPRTVDVRTARSGCPERLSRLTGLRPPRRRRIAGVVAGAKAFNSPAFLGSATMLQMHGERLKVSDLMIARLSCDQRFLFREALL